MDFSGLLCDVEKSRQKWNESRLTSWINGSIFFSRYGQTVNCSTQHVSPFLKRFFFLFFLLFNRMTSQLLQFHDDCSSRWEQMTVPAWFSWLILSFLFSSVSSSFLQSFFLFFLSFLSYFLHTFLFFASFLCPCSFISFLPFSVFVFPQPSFLSLSYFLLFPLSVHLFLVISPFLRSLFFTCLPSSLPSFLL